MKFALLLLGTLLFSACSISKDEKNESFSYDFTYNGCNTGKHTFSSKTDMCAGLQNEALNKGCAQNLRYEHFKQNCSGNFKPNNNNWIEAEDFAIPLEEEAD